MTVHREWTLDALIAAYEDHLRHTCGVRESTTRYYTFHARRFLRAVLGYDPLDIGRLLPSTVVEYISAKAKDQRPKTIKSLGTTLRSLFRFFAAAGIDDRHLQESVPSTPDWRLSTLPRHLDEPQLKQLLDSLDISTPRLRRDRAMILCLSALGLRAGEVAGIELGDIDWRSGTIRIRSRKTRRGALMPLPRDVGDAFVAYVQDDRPKTSDRHVFVKHRQGIGEPIRGATVTQAVKLALQRSGIDAPSFGAHLLRHTLATRMVRHGASLKEIADVLGHRTLHATAIYAKADVPSLAGVALPWPQVTS